MFVSYSSIKFTFHFRLWTTKRLIKHLKVVRRAPIKSQYQCSYQWSELITRCDFLKNLQENFIVKLHTRSYNSLITRAGLHSTECNSAHVMPFEIAEKENTTVFRHIFCQVNHGLLVERYQMSKIFF